MKNASQKLKMGISEVLDLIKQNKNYKCKNKTDDTDMALMETMAFGTQAVYTALIHIPEADTSSFDMFKDIAAKTAECKAIIAQLRAQKQQEERTRAMNVTQVAIQRMQSTISAGFMELHKKLNVIRAEIRKGNALLDDVDKLIAENKFRRYKLKLTVVLDKMQEALDATEDDPVAILTFMEMCNSVENNDKFLIQELDEIVSMDRTTFLGLSMHLKHFIDSVFLQGFNLIENLIKDLKSYRTLCYLYTNNIKDQYDPQVRKGIITSVRMQIQMIYGKIIKLNKNREQMYFNKETFFPFQDEDHKKRIEMVINGPRGYDPYLNNNYVLFDTRNYTVYKRYRYSIEFGNGQHIHDEVGGGGWKYFNNPEEQYRTPRSGIMGIEDPLFSFAYDKQHVSTFKVKIENGVKVNENLKHREVMHVVRSRINSEEYPIPPQYISQVESFIREHNNQRKSPHHILRDLWCLFDNYHLMSVYSTPAPSESGIMYPHYSLGNCHSFNIEHPTPNITIVKQWITCFFVADTACSENKRGKSHDYIRHVDM